MHVHRVREPDFPKDDLDAFIAWVDHMNADMLATVGRPGSAPVCCTFSTTGTPFAAHTSCTRLASR